MNFSRSVRGNTPYYLLKLMHIMRASLLLLFIVIAQLHAGNLYSQSTVINLSLRNVTVEQVLDQIERDTEFSFLFTDKSVDTDRKVNMNVRSKSINETLNVLFDGTDVSYRIVDRQVILSKKKFDTDGINQSKQLTGVIKDANGEPVIGANVVEKARLMVRYLMSMEVLA